MQQHALERQDGETTLGPHSFWETISVSLASHLTQKAARQVKPWPKRKRPALDMTDLILQMQKESAADTPGIQNTLVPVHLL